MKAKEFLLNECCNLEQVLEETLRYEYGLEGSRIFFEECDHRLGQIKKLIEASPEDLAPNLSENFYRLEELSGLISRIERSSLKEYSWPFLEEFKEISLSACTDPDTTQKDVYGNPYPPQVHVLSEGGLSCYQIHVDGRRIPGRRKILTIFFPRTLKHYVLLHPILGHEIGHAIYSISAYEKQLNQIIFNCLLEDNPRFASDEAFTNWVYVDSPKSIQIFLAAIDEEVGVNKENFISEFVDLESWNEEFICDFIGLLMFGPSFLAALCDLLYSIDPSGSEIGNYHPPTGCRINTLIVASKLLGYESIQFDAEIQPSVNAFWESINEKKQSEPWFDVFSEEQIKCALEQLSAFLDPHPNALYGKATKDNIQPLIKKLQTNIPPVGYEFKLEMENGKNVSELLFEKEVDFRDILIAGWIAASCGEQSLEFEIANRLCEHGILQQRAIKMMQTQLYPQGS